MPLGLICIECGKIIRRYSRQEYVPKNKRKFPTEEYRTVYTPKGHSFGYIVTYCSDNCHNKYKDRKKEWRNKRQKLRKVIFKRQNGKCLFKSCDNPIEDIHHLKSLAQKGGNIPSNLVGLCKYHHRRHHRLKGC